MKLEDWSPERVEKAKACKTTEDLLARASGGICSTSSRIASSTALLMLIMSLQIFFSSSV